MLVRFFRGRRSLLLENLALRQQVVALKRRHPRPSLGHLDKLFWVAARRAWSDWKQSLILVTPETVARWHRSGFRLYWRLMSRVRRQVGRKPTPKEVQELIFRMLVENPTWGAPRIHGELRMLGFDLSERTVSRWMKQAPRDADRVKRWFFFPKGTWRVLPGQVYSIRLQGDSLFGWKYVVGGYKNGAASFNGKPLLPDKRSTFLFPRFGAEL
jgi:hypothetical protein